LSHGSGVAGAISRAGGPNIQRDSNEYIDKEGKVPTGQCVLMDAHNLQPIRFVVHTVGPSVRGSVTPQDERHLSSAVSSSLYAAAEEGAASIAIPCISTGIFGFPVDKACSLIVGACTKFAASPPPGNTLRSIVLIDISTDRVQTLKQCLGRAGGAPPPSLPTAARGGLSSTHSGPVIKAAGLLAVRLCGGRVQVLLSVEHRSDSFKGKWSSGESLHVLGGQTDYRDGGDSRKTAAREFWEETGKLVKEQDVQSAIREADSLYLDYAKYQLYVVSAPPEAHTLPKLFQQRHGASVSVECSSLAWVGLDALVAALNGGKGKGKGKAQQVKADVGLKRHKSFPLSEFLSKILRDKAAMALVDQVAKTCSESGGGDPALETVLRTQI
ncbi:hypothetical protein KIPB_011887, partial [Kipferlia bialata]